jgi:hypothetical protein
MQGKSRAKTDAQGQPTDFESAVGQLNQDFFFRDFTYSTSTFTPEGGSEVELADNVVWLDDLFIVLQVKERHAPATTTAEKESKWFEAAVLKKATSQIRDTLKYLAEYATIELLNNRGQVFNVASADLSRIQKLVVHHPHKLLPDECRFQKYHQSRTAGIIHLIGSGDYFAILRTLITPVEIAEYLAFREALVIKNGAKTCEVSEKALVGQYIRGLSDATPSDEFEQYVDEVEQKGKSWDISRIIHLFPERRTTPIESEKVGYKVLKELAKLNRRQMAEFKKRFQLSMEKAKADAFCPPKRFGSEGGCGFVFVPLQREDIPYWRNALLNFAGLNKYEQKLDRCIGVAFMAVGDGKSYDAQWCFLDFPWKEDPKLQAALDRSYPFGPVKVKRVERYGLSEMSDGSS